MQQEGASAQYLDELRSTVLAARSGGLSSLTTEQLERFPDLSRFAASLLARLQASGHDAELLSRTRELVAQSHALLHKRRSVTSWTVARQSARLLMVESPRAIRAEWKLLAASFALFYALALLAFAAVRRDLGMAFSLFNAEAVWQEIEQLRATEPGQPFRGNFSFGSEESHGTAGAIIGNNVSVAVLFFAAGLVPPLYLFILATNALMLGTYTGVAAHWEQALAISSIVWCHGAIEMQMIVLAGAAGLVLARAWIAPGPWSRGFALRTNARRAWHMLAPVPLWLLLAGLIEGYVSPHAPLGVRVAVAGASLVLLLAWVLLPGARPEPPVQRD
jgi:uncharacterized membrane protein SpoIIM required for sporulation